MHDRRVLIVAQAFKGTLSADEVAGALARAVERAGATADVIRGSDGGDGLLEALAPLLERHTSHVVEGPLGARRRVPVGWLSPSCAVIESRLVCGLALLAQRDRDPLRTTTRGLGTLIRQVHDGGATVVYVGLGGSATMDGGVGMARAWGWDARDAAGMQLPDGGGALADLSALIPGEGPGVDLTGLCDVRNPLTGPRGARVYAPQKGASPQKVERLASGLERLAEVAGAMGSVGLAGRPGAGAAGGVGFGILMFGRGRLEPGAAWVLERVGFEVALSRADLVVTGEGGFDETSLEGKLTGEVIVRARRRNVPMLLLAPRARCVPDDVRAVSGGDSWTIGDLEARAGVAIKGHFRLLAG